MWLVVGVVMNAVFDRYLYLPLAFATVGVEAWPRTKQQGGGTPSGAGALVGSTSDSVSLMAAGQDLTLGQSWRVVVRRRWIVITCVALGVLGGIAATMLQSTVYESRAQILVERVGGGAVFDDNVSEQRDVDVTVQTEIQLLEGDGVRNRVQEALGLAEPPEPVRGRQVDGTLVVEVTASDDDPASATALAQACKGDCSS